MNRARFPLFPLALLLTLAVGSSRAEAIRVAGKVAAAGGSPIAGARVELWPSEDPLRAARDRALGTETRASAAVVTDDAGRYSIEAPRPGVWSVRVDAPGFVPAEWRIHPLVESLELDDLLLDPDAGLLVRVLDPGGAPIPDAVVVGEPARSRFDFGTRTLATTQRKRTGADGTVRLARGDRASLDVRVYAKGYPVAETDDQRGTAATVRMTPGVAATVVVVGADGKPVPGAYVFGGSDLAAAGRTDDAGRCSVMLRRPGKTSLSVLAEDDRQARRLLDAPADDAPIRIALPNRHVLVGRVIDVQSRRPVPEAVVWDTREASTFTSTDSSGSFALGGEIGRLLELSAASPGYLQSEPHEIHLLDDGTPGLTLALKAAAAVEGKVVDGDGRPIPGAELSLEERRSPNGMMRIEIGRARNRAKARSDAEGRFRLSPIDPEKSWDLAASAEGYAAAQQSIGALEPHRAKSGVRVSMTRGRAITGTVVDADETAIPGAAVRITKAAAPSHGPGMIRVMTGGPDAPAAEGTTTDDGRFLVRGIADGKYDVEVKRRGYAPRKLPSIEIGARDETVDVGAIVLAPGETLEGHVRDRAGAPIEGAEITVREAAAGPMFLTVGPPGRAATEPDAVTDAGGYFSVPDLSSERHYSVDARRRGYVAGGAPAVELPRVEPLAIALEAASDISGRVVDARQEGVAGARVALERARTIEIGGNVARTIMMQDTIADAEGRFLFEDEEPGAISLSGSAPGYQDAKLDDVAVPAGEDLEGLVLPLSRGAVLEGRVLAPDGRAAIGTTVRALSGEPSDMPSLGPGRAGVDGDGYYRLDGLAPGIVSIEATHDDYPRVARDVELRAGRNSLDMTFTGGTDVTGFVRDDAGSPVSEAAVTLLPAGRFWNATDVRTGPDGSFRFLGVTPGSYRARADAAGFARATLESPIEVTDQPVGGVEITLSAGGAIVGTVRGVEETRLSEVTIEARGGPSGSSAAPDYRGRYRLEHLAPGTYSVQAQLGASGRQASGEVTVERDAEAQLDLEFGSGVTLSGLALAGDTPVTGATVFVEGTDVDAEGLTRTDQAGRFTIDGLDPGTYRVDLREFVSGVSHTETVSLASSREVVLRLPANRIAGTVIDATDHQPLAGVSLTLGATGGSASPPRSATTDVQGRFSIASVPDGEFRLTASRKGYAAEVTTVAVTNGRSPEDVRLALDATEGLALEVRLPSGAIPSEVQIAVLDGSGSSLVSGHYATGENGSVRLSSVPPGPWSLLVSAPGAATSNVSVRAPGPKIQVALSPATALAVQVPPLAGSNTVATARLRDSSGAPFRTLGWTGAPRSEWPVSAGRIEFGTLPPDTWTVEVLAADGRTWTGTATTNPGAPASLVLDR